MNLDPYIKNLIRSSMKVIPVIGSPIDQLTFGYYESLNQQEVKKKIEALQQSIWNLILEKRNEDDILNIVKSSDIYKELNEQKTQIKINRELVNQNEKRLLAIIELQNEKIKALDSYLKETKLGLNSKIKHLSRTISANEKLIQKINSEKKLEFRVARVHAIELLEFINIILELGSRVVPISLLLDSYIIFNCTHFPDKEKIHQNIEILYTILLDEIKLTVLDSDLPDIQKIKLYLAKLNPRYTLKHKTIPSSTAWKILNEIIAKIDIKKHEISSVRINRHVNEILPILLSDIKIASNIHAQKIASSCKNDIKRFLYLSENSDQYFICSNVSSQKSQFTYNYLKKKIPANRITDWEPLKIALYSYLSLKNEISNIKDSNNFIKTQVLAKKLEEAKLNNEITFTSLDELKLFDVQLNYINSIVNEFKDHIEINLFKRLKVLYDEEVNYMKNYIEFAKAFFELDSIIKMNKEERL